MIKNVNSSSYKRDRARKIREANMCYPNDVTQGEYLYEKERKRCLDEDSVLLTLAFGVCLLAAVGYVVVRWCL